MVICEVKPGSYGDPQFVFPSLRLSVQSGPACEYITRRNHTVLSHRSQPESPFLTRKDLGLRALVIPAYQSSGLPAGLIAFILYNISRRCYQATPTVGAESRESGLRDLTCDCPGLGRTATPDGANSRGKLRSGPGAPIPPHFPTVVPFRRFSVGPFREGVGWTAGTS